MGKPSEPGEPDRGPWACRTRVAERRVGCAAVSRSQIAFIASGFSNFAPGLRGLLDRNLGRLGFRRIPQPLAMRPTRFYPRSFGRLEHLVKCVRIWLAVSSAPQGQPHGIRRPGGRPASPPGFCLVHSGPPARGRWRRVLRVGARRRRWPVHNRVRVIKPANPSTRRTTLTDV